MREVIDRLQELSLAELADVFRYVQRVRASRGDRPSPEFVSRLVAVVSRLYAAYSERVPISLVHAHFASVPRGLTEQALFEVGAGIPYERGLLYWIVPSNS